MKIALSLIAFSLAAVSAHRASAEIVTATATIEAVDVVARTITVRRNTAKGEKTAKLAVGLNAEVSIDSQRRDLKSLKAGQSVTISYDTAAKQVTVIIARSSSPPPADEGDPKGILPPEDAAAFGGHSYKFFREVMTWHQAKRRCVVPRTPSHRDRRWLEMVFLSSAGTSGEILHATKRANLGQAFGRAKVIAELAAERQAKCLSLAPDGRTLCFWRVGGEVVVCTRDEKGARWSKPKPLRIRSDGLPRSVNWPDLAAGGLRLFCAGEGGGQLLSGHGNLMFSSRRTVAEPFTTPRTIEITGLPPLSGRSPRYVAATGELFFTRAIIENGKPNWVGIWAVKNFSPPASTP